MENIIGMIMERRKGNKMINARELAINKKLAKEAVMTKLTKQINYREDDNKEYIVTRPVNPTNRLNGRDSSGSFPLVPLENAFGVYKFCNGLKKEGKSQTYSLEDKSLSKSSVENTFILDCFLKAFSSDQIGMFLANARAKYGSSLGESICGGMVCASARKSSYSSSEKKIISLLSVKKINSKSAIDTPPNFIIFSFAKYNSSNTNCGERILQLLSNKSLVTCLLTEFDLKNENNMLASTTKIFGSFTIFYKPCLFATLSLSSFDNSHICSSVNFDFDMISSNTANLILLSNCFITLVKTISNFFFNSLGTSTLTTISAIENSYINGYKKLSEIIKNDK